jgi:hypothetical protein
MNRLCGNAEDKLDPEVPVPAEICISISLGCGIKLSKGLHRSIGPPMTPPMLVPIVELSTMKHSAQCCVSGSYRSAIKPKVTEPPAVDSPPNALHTTIVPKLGATAFGICQMLMKNNES